MQTKVITAREIRYTVLLFFLFGAALFSFVVAWELLLEPLLLKEIDFIFVVGKELAWLLAIQGVIFSIFAVKILTSAKHFSQLIDTANAPIIGIDLLGNVNEWNQSMEKITGYTKAEAIGKALVREFIIEDAQNSVQQILNKALKGTDTANYEFPIDTKDKQRVMLLLNASTRRDMTGKITGATCIGQDVTELGVAKVITKELRQLIDTANAPIIGIDLWGNVNEWNQSMEKIAGYTKAEAIGKALVREFITEDAQNSVQQILNKALTGTDTANYEFPINTKDKQRVMLLLNASARRDLTGRITGVVGIGQDITELQKSQIMTIQASKLSAIGEMATSIAHELNQPLSTIRMVTSNLGDRIESGEISHDYLVKKLQRIEDQVYRASVIINQLRVFGRIPNNELVPLDPRILMQSVLGLLGEQFRLANIEVTTGCDFDCPLVLANQIQLEQVFFNLLTNARDAILKNQENTKNKISIKGYPAANNQLEISISDTGGGIEESILTKIFEPFVTTKSLGQGTGLGLSISYGIIHDMNGTITAENINGGARFTITLPLADVPALADVADRPRAIADLMLA